VFSFYIKTTFIFVITTTPANLQAATSKEELSCEMRLACKRLAYHS